MHYNTVEGYLIDYKIEFSKSNRDKGTNFSAAWVNRYGFYSKKYYSKARVFYRFNRTNRMSIRAEGGHYVEQFNGGAVGNVVNSLYSILLEENYMKLQQHSYGEVSWGVEAFNGFRLNLKAYFGQRRSLENAPNLDGTFADYKEKYFSLNEPGNESNRFNDAVYGNNNALVLTVGFTYRPGMKYMERPNGKINLGTKWPEFAFNYEKGLGGFGKLDANYDLLKLRISDDHSFGMVGRFEWEASAGWFPNNKFVPFMNWTHFNTSRVHITSSGVGRFMALPYYSASTNQYYVQVHAEQHFNGFILNKIPLLKKLKWQVVGGVHYLYEPTFGNYWEVTAGVENIFQIIRVDFVAPFRERDVQQFAFRFQLGF
ncbi:MAG TPA: hypothetical protein DCR04_01290 [Flavobacteriales bacterium]|nr:hypothetical protein [Flavobacteriales bacterium]